MNKWDYAWNGFLLGAVLVAGVLYLFFWSSKSNRINLINYKKLCELKGQELDYKAEINKDGEFDYHFKCQ